MQKYACSQSRGLILTDAHRKKHNELSARARAPPPPPPSLFLSRARMQARRERERERESVVYMPVRVCVCVCDCVAEDVGPLCVYRPSRSASINQGEFIH